MSDSNSLFTVFVKTQQDDGDLAIPGLHGGVTTRDLKEAISRSHSLRPSVSQMKLIFAGRVLPDHSTLTEAFAPVGARECYTIHLVTSLGSSSSSSLSSSSSPAFAPSSSATSSSSSSSSYSTSTSTSSSSSSYHRSQQHPGPFSRIVHINGIPYVAIPYTFQQQRHPASFFSNVNNASSQAHPEQRTNQNHQNHVNHHHNVFPRPAHEQPAGGQNANQPAPNANQNQNQNQIANQPNNRHFARAFFAVFRFFLFFYFFASNMTGERFFFLCMVGCLIFVYEFGLLDPFILLRRGLQLLRPIGSDHTFMQRGPHHIALRLFLAFFVSLLPNIEFTPFPKPEVAAPPNPPPTQGNEEANDGNRGQEGAGAPQPPPEDHHGQVAEELPA